MVCALGFEPNPRHATYSKEVESIYGQFGWRVKMMTRTAASDTTGTTRFYTNGGFKGGEVGGGILPPILIHRPRKNCLKVVFMM